MMHIVLHLAVPVIVSLLFYRSRWKQAAIIMLLTMLVDMDHLLSDPVYDPERCSIGFHPLHTIPAIGIYAVLFALPWLPIQKAEKHKNFPPVKKLHLTGLGLLLHMVLDGVDCLF